MKIYLINMMLTEKGIKETVKEYECKRTASGFKADRVSGFGGKTTLIKNSDILRIDTFTVNRVDLITYYTWYLSKVDKQLVQNMLWRKLREDVENNRKASNKLIEYFN